MLTSKPAVRLLLLTVFAGTCISSIWAMPPQGPYGSQQNVPPPPKKNEEPEPDKTKLGMFGKTQVDAKTAEEQISKRVEPVYPQMALLTKIQGDVIVHVMIDKKGHVAKVKAIAGHPMLIDAALAAAKQWEYVPFYTNGKPMEVETNILFKFVPKS